MNFKTLAKISLGGFLFTALIQAAIDVANEPAAEVKTCTKEAWACAAEKRQLSMRWNCEKTIKSGLKDPRSYQAHKVGYFPSLSDKPNALVMVKINYGARNGFGGMSRGNAVCYADKDGNILEAKFLG